MKLYNPADRIKDFTKPAAGSYNWGCSDEDEGEGDFEPGDLTDSIHDYFAQVAPDDPCFDEIRDDTTFQDLLDALQKGSDVYDLLGPADTVIREIAFERLHQITGMERGKILEMWITH